VFTTDHGEQLGDHWLFGKRSWFEQAFHIPLIVRDPRTAADRGRGRQVEAFSEAVDVTPTILEWLGLEVPPACDGESLLPFLAGGEPDHWRAEAHWELDFRDMTGQRLQRDLGLASDQCALNVVRGERYKYVHFAALPPLFYDLQEDPYETRNLADEPGYRERVMEHAQKLLSWRMTHDERTLTGYELTVKGAVHRKGPRYGIR